MMLSEHWAHGGGPPAALENYGSATGRFCCAGRNSHP